MNRNKILHLDQGKEIRLTLGFQSSSAKTTNDAAVNVIAALHATKNTND